MFAAKEVRKNVRLNLRRGLLMGVLLALAGAGQAQVVVVAGRNVGELGKDQVADIFLGKATALPGGGAVVPVDQVESSALREEFYSRFTGKSAAQARSLWSRLAFTGKGSPPREMGSSAEVKKFVAGTPGAIGYIEKAAVDDTVKIVFGAQ
jgi:ABC-type phosphate transport system substrate-binding protein